jgi:hypothetical protein
MEATMEKTSCPQPSYFEKNKFTILRNITYLTVIFLLIIIPTFKIVKIDMQEMKLIFLEIL